MEEFRSRNTRYDYPNDALGQPEDDDPEIEEEEKEEEIDANKLRDTLVSQLESPYFSNRLRTQIKAQIRATLALQMTSTEVLTAKPPHQRSDPVRELANAIVAQHLLTSGCDFSLSVFLPESGLNSELHPMNLSDLLLYLRVRYPSFNERAVAEDRSLLSLLVSHLPVSSDHITSRFTEALSTDNERINTTSDKSVQTERLRREQDFLDLELKHHQLKTRLGWRQGENFDVEALLNKFGNDVASEIRKRALSEFTQNNAKEIQNALEETNERHSRELLSVTATWEARLQEAQTRYELLHQRLTNAEQKSFLERQEWLQKQEMAEKEEVKNREVVEARLRELDGKEREIVTRAKQLAEYGQSLVAKESYIQRKVDQKVGELVRLKAKALDEREEKMRKDETSLTKLKDHLTRTIMTDNGEPDVTATEPRPFLQKIKSEFSRLHRENQKLKTRLATIADYENLKTQKSDLEREVKNLRSQLASAQHDLGQERQEHAATIRDLTEKLIQPDRRVEETRKEAETAKERLMLDTLRWEAERGRLRTVLKERDRELERLKERAENLQEKLEGVTAKLNRMQGLTSQASWMLMQNGHNSNHVHQQPSYVPTVSSRLVPPLSAIDPPSGDESSSSHSSIADAKKRIKALEREANDMQAHFSQYRRYVTDQYHTPPKPPLHNGSSSSLDRPEHPRKLLLTQYLLQGNSKSQTSPRNSLSNFSQNQAKSDTTPPRGEKTSLRVNGRVTPISAGFSRGDFGAVRSLELELRDAERASSSQSPRMETRLVNDVNRKVDEGGGSEAESEVMGLEARMTADVRNLMAAADENGGEGW